MMKIQGFNWRKGILTLMRAIIANACLFSTLGYAEPSYKSGKPGKEINLFNGKDFSGWAHYYPDPKIKLEDVWSVDLKNKMIISTGEPDGYIYTRAQYTNFILNLDWRWSPITKKIGNSGVLMRTNGPHKIWPRMVEANIEANLPGTIWVTDGKKLLTDPKLIGYRDEYASERLATKNAEKPPGEWNHLEVVFDQDEITIRVNGELVNQGTGAEVEPGIIGLQSEGEEAHFREIRITPLGSE